MARKSIGEMFSSRHADIEKRVMRIDPEIRERVALRRVKSKTKRVVRLRKEPVKK